MNTYPIVDAASGIEFAFEIENVYISAREAASLLRAIPGVSNVRKRMPFSRQADMRVAFEYKGNACAVVEPFGDNSRFWIGPVDPAQTKFDVSALRTAFLAHRPPGLKRLVGDLLSLRLFGRR